MPQLTRRSFIKNAHLSAGAVGLSAAFPSAMALGAQASTTVLTAGRYGPINCSVKDGKLVSSKGALDIIIENSLATTAPDQVYTKARVKYPMVRKGYLANPEAGSEGKRGKDEFVKVSWEDAMNLIHEQHMRIRNKYGNESIFGGSYGWRSSGVLHKAQTLLQRYLSMAGGYSGHLGDYSTGAAQVIMPHVMGSIEVYEQQTTHPVILESSETVVFWGINPMNTLKIGWSSSDESGRDFFDALRKSGKKIIALDPMVSETIEFFGDKAEWIPINSGTDVALGLGIAHEMISQGLHDQEFLKKYTIGFDKFEPYIKGDSDGVAKTPEWAAEITGIPADTIKSLAKTMTSSRTMIMAGWGIQRQQYGEQKHWMIATLAAMIGQIGLPGGGFGLSYHYANGGNPTRKAAVLPAISASIGGASSGGNDWAISGAINSFPVARIVEALENPGGKYQHNGSEKTFPDIKMIWWAGGGNFTHHQDTNRLHENWQKPELIVISEPYWTAAAKNADIVLPITTTLERNDMTMTGDYSNQHLVPMKQVIKPVFEARNDLDVFADMAERLKPGGKNAYMEGKDEMGWLNEFYTKAQEGGRAARIRMPRFAQFWGKNELIEMKTDKKNQKFVRHAEYRKDPILNPLGTPSGKIEIYSKTIEGFGYEDCPPHPTWIEPSEWLGNAKEGQLQLITSHPPHRLHSQFNYASLREKYAVQNREPITINTNDAKKYGIADGDLVRCYNDRGEVLVGALVSDGIKEGTVCIHEGAWPDQDKGEGICRNGGVNVLTQDIPTSRLANGCAGNTNLVMIEKFSGSAPDLMAFTPPAGA